MSKNKKITWAVIFADFKARHPRLSKTVLRYEPYNYATILLIFPESLRMTYDYDTKQIVKLKKI